MIIFIFFLFVNSWETLLEAHQDFSAVHPGDPGVVTVQCAPTGPRGCNCVPRGPRGCNCAPRIWSCIPPRVGSDCLYTFLNQSYVPLPNLWCTAPNLRWTAANPGFTKFGSSSQGPPFTFLVHIFSRILFPGRNSFPY